LKGERAGSLKRQKNEYMEGIEKKLQVQTVPIVNKFLSKNFFCWQIDSDWKNISLQNFSEKRTDLSPSL